MARKNDDVDEATRRSLENAVANAHGVTTTVEPPSPEVVEEIVESRNSSSRD